MTVRELLEIAGTEQRVVGRRSLDLVSLGNSSGSKFLRLTEQPDGRIDLEDCNTGDACGDFGDDRVSVLKLRIRVWLDSIGYTGKPGPDDDPDSWKPAKMFWELDELLPAGLK